MINQKFIIFLQLLNNYLDILFFIIKINFKFYLLKIIIFYYLIY